MKRPLFILLAALVIGGCSNTEAGKTERHAAPVPSGTVMQEGSETADPGGSGTDRKGADEPAKQASGPKDGTSEAAGSEPDPTRGAGTEGTKTTASQQQAGARAGSPPRLDAARLANTYGFADNTGKYILSFENMEADDLDTAIGKDGRPLNIRFVKKQPQGSQDNGTRSANNFSNVQGLLYEVVDGNAEPNETYYLANSGRFNVASLLQVKPETRVGASDEVKRNIEAAKSQKIDKIWKIADIAPDKELYVVQFRKQGKRSRRLSCCGRGADRGKGFHGRLRSGFDLARGRRRGDGTRNVLGPVRRIRRRRGRIVRSLGRSGRRKRLYFQTEGK